jgi:hypothetical protein
MVFQVTYAPVGGFFWGREMKTMFNICLMEDEHGFVTVSADHYGPGEASYFFGMQMLLYLKRIEKENPSNMKVEKISYASKTQ